MTTPAEREAAARAVVMQTMTFGYGPDSDLPLGSAQWERSVALTTKSNAAELDLYRAAVAETVRAEGAGETTVASPTSPQDDVIEVAKRELRAAIRLHRRASDADMAMRAVMRCEAALIHAVRKHDSATPPLAPEVTEADLSFITGNLLIDVDSCAMGTATETHYDVAARDLRGRIVRLLAAERGR